MRRFHHHFAGEPPSTFGPVEFGWEDGSFTILDVKTDWTLEVADGPWVDPYGDATARRRKRLEREVGLWEPAEAVGLLQDMVDHRVEEAELVFNEVGETVGLRLVTRDVVVTARAMTGQLVVLLERR